MKLAHLIATGVLAIAAAGAGYYAYTNYLYPPLVTTSIATVAPVSEAVYGTGTVEPARWAKVVPLQRRRLVDLCSCEGQTVKAGQVLGRQDDAEERNALDQMEINPASSNAISRAPRRIATRATPRATNTSSAGPSSRNPNRGSPPKRCGSTRWCCGRRSTAWCCGATARSARSQVPPTCCSGSARRCRCRSSPRSTRRKSTASRSARRRFCAARRSRTGAARQRLADHAEGRPDPQDLPRLSVAAARYPAADRHVGRGQHHLP